MVGNLGFVTRPSWVSDLEVKPAPMPLLLVQAFVNTRDGEQGTDLLTQREPAARWLTAAAIIGAGVRLAEADLRAAREVREAVRVMIGRNDGGPELGDTDLRPLRDLLSRTRVTLSVGADGQVRLADGPAAGLPDGLLRLLLIVRDAQADGTWDRLKLCANPDCRWVFYDRSHRQAGTWCDMSTCGNRMKNRSLRARRALTQSLISRELDTAGAPSRSGVRCGYGGVRVVERAASTVDGVLPVDGRARRYDPGARAVLQSQGSRRDRRRNTDVRFARVGPGLAA
jgi:predicted RNA-binding Zn ribbon-like protein